MARNYTAPRPDGWGSIDVSARAAARAIRIDPRPDAVNALHRPGRWERAGPDGDGRAARARRASRTRPSRSKSSGPPSVPRPFARTGYIGDYYFIAQWFPKLGVLEDAGWNTHQFHARHRVLRGLWRLRRPHHRPHAVRRRRHGPSDGTHRQQPTARRRTAITVRTSTTSRGRRAPTYIDESGRSRTRRCRPSRCALLLQPEHRGQADRYFAATEAALKRYGEWFGAYPYGHATIVDPAYQSQADGMEYPTLFTGRARWLPSATRQTPEMTVAHEAGHQWWYGMVATNEFEHAWMDEGFNTYATARVLDGGVSRQSLELRYFGSARARGRFPTSPFSRLDNDRHHRLPRQRRSGHAGHADVPLLAGHGGDHVLQQDRAVAAHARSVISAGRRCSGSCPPTSSAGSSGTRGPRTSFDRERGQRPGPDLVLRPGLSKLEHVRLRRAGPAQRSPRRRRPIRTVGGRAGGYGEATFPVDVVTTFADGHRITERWDGTGSPRDLRLRAASRAASAQVDPRRVLLLDINYTNNSRTLGRAGREAGLKWAA